ncbi:MAG: hypothetical protein NVSMB31_08120 [Vulcanimicrobiaceae bacterium]
MVLAPREREGAPGPQAARVGGHGSNASNAKVRGMADKKSSPLLEALKIAKASKNGVPMQIQNAVKEIETSTDENERRRWANEVSRWLYAESSKPGVDKFTVMGYSALQNALAPYLAHD